MENIIKISVRNMVEFVLRQGNIDSLYLGSKRAQEGIRIHKKIQKKRENEGKLNDFTYHKEYSLKMMLPYKEFEFQINGRADGVKIDAEFVTIEEIKSTAYEINEIEHNPNHWHWAQAKCYGYLLVKEKGENFENIKIMLTYCNLENEDMRSFENIFLVQELEKFFFDILERYYIFAKLDQDRIRERNQTGEKLEFPFAEYRENQRQFAVGVYKTIQQEKNLFIQAPTGTGKTISTLFPVIKGMVQGYSSKIFYLTAKNITRQVAEEAFLQMSKKGLKIRCITLTAKDKICFKDETKCNPIDCEYANGHFDRVNNALIDIIQNETIIKKQTIIEYGKKHMVCPLEFSFDISLFCDCIICDYNHVYDLKASIKRYFDGEKKDYIILNDEAHNLVERSRDMFSAAIFSSDYDLVRKEFRKKDNGVYKSLMKIKHWFEKEAESLNTISTYETLPEDINHLLMDFAYKTEIYMGKNRNESNETFLNIYFKTRDFLKIWELFDKRYIYYKDTTSKNIQLKLFCQDPSYLLSTTHKNVRTSIFFSATLTPINYYKDILGGDTQDYSVCFHSPFSKENLCLLIENRISTYYKSRNSSFEPIVARIFQLTKNKKGNYLVFFPSYEYLNRTVESFINAHPDVSILVQTPKMDEDEREKFISHFMSEQKQTLIGFVVMGGVFSEGIDLPGEKLIGAVVVGVGMPLISLEKDLIKEYYIKKGINGFDYAYVYPGLNKVMQAAGRVIRTNTDRGVVLLIDSRFTTEKYMNLFPHEWEHLKVVDGENLTTMVDEFWGKSSIDQGVLTVNPKI